MNESNEFKGKFVIHPELDKSRISDETQIAIDECAFMRTWQMTHSKGQGSLGFNLRDGEYEVIIRRLPSKWEEAVGVLASNNVSHTDTIRVLHELNAKGLLNV